MGARWQGSAPGSMAQGRSIQRGFQRSGVKASAHYSGAGVVSPKQCDATSTPLEVLGGGGKDHVFCRFFLVGTHRRRLIQVGQGQLALADQV